MIEEIRKELEGQEISKIEEEVSGLKKQKDDAIERMTRILFYLERTKRYKENPRYKQVPFERYIQDRFGIPYSRYQSHRIALVKYPVEAEKYGVDVVVRASRACGEDQAKRVFNDLGKRKKTPRLVEIDDTIRKYASKPKAKEPEKSELKLLQEENERLKQALADKDKELQEKNEQINRLISTIEKLKEQLQSVEEVA